jgi:copper(I)-binding protein
MLRRLIPLVFAAMVAPVAAHQYELGTLVIGHPWTRPAPATMSVGVAYLSITNNGKEADTLIAASTPAAETVQFHRTSIVEGVARMRPMADVAIPPGATVRIEPGGIHLMLVTLKSALEVGKPVALTLQFRKAGRITVQLAVQPDDGA